MISRRRKCENEITASVSSQEQPVIFDNIDDIDEIVNIIDNYYELNAIGDINLRAAAGTKWRAGSVVYVGNGSQLITNHFWVRGSNMSTSNVVGRAQRNAVISTYGSVNNNTIYKMKTEQRLNMSPQTQGYVTVSAKAWCYARS